VEGGRGTPVSSEMSGAMTRTGLAIA
jgi:hypothetical protein